MALVLVVIELFASLAQLATALVALVVEDITRLQEHLAHVLVHVVEPVPEPLVLLGVLVQGAHGVADGAQAAAIREPFEEGADLVQGGLQVGVGGKLLMGVFAVAGDGASVRRVLLEEVEEPLHRALIVIVALALVNHLCDGWIC